MTADQPIKLRASSLPMAFTCPGSVRLPGISIDPVNDAAAGGTAAHAVMELIAKGDLSSLETIDIAKIAQEHQVDGDELRMQAVNGLLIWREIRPAYIGGAAEIDLKATIAGVELTGHGDLFARDEKRANGTDWKFGRLDYDYYHQIATYMVLTLFAFPELEEVTWTLCWMRDYEIEVYRMTRADADAWIAKFKREIVDWDGQTFRPSKAQCHHCKRSASCPALAATARRDVAILSEEPTAAARIEAGIGDLAPAEIVRIYRRSKVIQAFCESFQEQVKVLVDREGSLSDGEGAQLCYVPTKGSREVDVLKAWEALQERLSDEEMAEVVRVRLSKADDIIAKKAGKGNGARSKRLFNAALEAAGAVTKIPGRQFRDQRTKEETP